MWTQRQQIYLPAYISACNLYVEMEDEWYCVQCRTFLPKDQFKSGPKRWICKRHYNEKWHTVRMQLWDKQPQERHANIIWQMAYRDSVTVFRLKIDITPAQLLLLLRDYNIVDARLLPLDPTKPLSQDNCLLTSLAIRKVVCRVWKQFHCSTEYNSALSHYREGCVHLVQD